jgi:hypothetical protein
MSTYKLPEYGEPDRYEITWMTGHIETVLAHQVSWPQNGSYLMRGVFGGGVGTEAQQEKRRIQFHAEIDGRWTLTLSALEEDIRTVRMVTEAEQIPGVSE